MKKSLICIVIAFAMTMGMVVVHNGDARGENHPPTKALERLDDGNYGSEVLVNGEFNMSGNELVGWSSFGTRGYQVAPGEGRNGSAAVTMQNLATAQQSGIKQQIILNQTATQFIGLQRLEQGGKRDREK